MLRYACNSSSPALANRLPSVVAWAGTLCERPAMTSVSYSAARSASRTSTVTTSGAHELQRSPHLQLLDVLGQVTRRHSLVDVLVARQVGELLDARLHVVTGDTLPSIDRRQIDAIDHVLVGLDRLPGHVDPELLLGLEDGDPELSLEHDLALGRPDVDHRRARVPRREHVRHAHEGFFVGRLNHFDVRSIAIRKGGRRRRRTS